MTFNQWPAENHHIQLGFQQFFSGNPFCITRSAPNGRQMNWELRAEKCESSGGIQVRHRVKPYRADLCSRYRFWLSLAKLRPHLHLQVGCDGVWRMQPTRVDPLFSSSNICCDCVTDVSAGDQRERQFESLCVFSSQNSCSFGLSVCGLKFSFCPSSTRGSFRHSLYFTLSWWLLSGVKLLLVKLQHV